MNKKSTFVKWRRYLPLYLMLIPGAVYIFINNYIPMAGLIMAFEKYDYKLGMFKSPKIGLDNFTYLFATKDALNITRNTLLYNAIFIILGNILAITVAILLNDVRSKTKKKLYQTLILIPYLISTVIVSYIVYGFLNTQNGFINNSILEPLGKNGIAWYSQPKYWPFIITFVYLWKNFGYSSIIYFATVVGIDKTYYEAAGIDGATIWQQIRYITLPLMKTVIIMMFIMAVGRIFYSDFGLFYQVPRDSNTLYNYVYTLDVYVFKQLKTSTTGMASAAAFVQSVAGCITILTANAIVRKIDRESAMI